MSQLRLIACTGLILAATLPALAQNDYGGYDIVGSWDGESYYADVGSWQVYAGEVGGQFAYCVAETARSDGSAFRLGWDGMQWQLAVPVNARADWEGTLQIDGMGSGQGYGKGGDYISGSAIDGWTIAWLGEAELSGLREGSEGILGVGKFDYDFPLTGATAASLKVVECVDNAGQAKTPRRSSSAAAAEPTERSAKLFAKSGDWTINEIRDGRRTVACEAVAGSGSLHFEIDADNVYIDFTDSGPMGDLGEVIYAKIRFDNGDPLDYQAEIIEGRDYNKWARITEGRNDGPGLIDDAFPNATQVSFESSNIFLDTHLSGSNRALDKFFSCSGNIQ